MAKDKAKIYTAFHNQQVENSNGTTTSNEEKNRRTLSPVSMIMMGRREFSLRAKAKHSGKVLKDNGW